MGVVLVWLGRPVWLGGVLMSRNYLAIWSILMKYYCIQD